MHKELVSSIEVFLNKLSPPVYPLHEPFIKESVEKDVLGCVRSSWVSSVGAYVDKLQEALRIYTKSPYVILTSTGTNALHTALNLFEIRDEVEVLLPSFTFVATGNALLYNRVVPHFVDIDHTGGISASYLKRHLAENAIYRQGSTINRKTGRIIKAIIVMHPFGTCVDSEVFDIAKSYNLIVIEDAAEALGSYDQNGKHHLGTLSDVGILSFNGNKIITSGGGGAILLNSQDLANKANHLISTAKLPHPWKYFHDQVGYNYRMPAINASLAYGQMLYIEEILQKKKSLYLAYKANINNRLGDFMDIPITANHWLINFVLKKEYSHLLEIVLSDLHSKFIYARPAWEPLHTLPAFNGSFHLELSYTEEMAKRILSLPSSPSLMSKTL